MARSKVGFQYYSVETDRYQDIRIKRLKKECGCNGLAVYDYLLCEIYRVKGCFLVWDESIAFDVADYFGLKENQVNEIVNYCSHVGLFSKELLARERILTSSSIQSRFIDWSRKAKRSTPEIPENISIIPEETGIITEETVKLTEESTQSKVKESKVKDDVVLPPAPSVIPEVKTSIYGASLVKGLEDLKADCLKDQINFVEHIYRQFNIRPPTLSETLDEFNAHLLSTGVSMKTVKDYRTHFQNWYRKRPGGNPSNAPVKIKLK